VLDRESSFADAEVIATLKKRFVPVALDVWYEERREDAAGDYFRKVVHQREGLKPDQTTQGFYAFAPDGTLLQGWNHRGADRLKQNLAKALDGWKPKKAKDAKQAGDGESVATPGGTDARFDRPLPEGARVVAVRAHITKAKWPEIERGDPLAEQWQEISRNATSLDHLWIDRDEIAALAAGTFPRTLAWRIARFHCIDNTRGEPPSWEPEQVKHCEATLARDGAKGPSTVDGAFTLATPDGALTYDARLGGVVESRDGELTRFDLAIRGDFAGHGEFTQGAPPGTFTLAIVLSLADEGDHQEVPPQGARWLDDYLGKVKGREGK